MESVVNRITERFNGWLASPWAFIQSIILSGIWTVFVILGIDRHGFLYLYVATQFSFITQFSLALLARRSTTEARLSAATNEQLLINSVDTMKVIIALAEELKLSIEEQDEILDEIQDMHLADHLIKEEK